MTDKRFIWANMSEMECLKIKLHNIQEFRYDGFRFTIVVKQGKNQWFKRHVIECCLEKKQAEILEVKIKLLVQNEQNFEDSISYMEEAAIE